MKNTNALLMIMVLVLWSHVSGIQAFAQTHYPATPYGDHLFRILKNLEARREYRQAEARRLNLTLPSELREDASPQPQNLIVTDTGSPQPTEIVQIPAPVQAPQVEPIAAPKRIAAKPRRASPTPNSIAAKPLQLDPAPQPLEFTPQPASPTPSVVKAHESLLTPLLARFEAKRAAREQQARNLGIILPSQSGSIREVSPALGNLHDKIQEIMHRTDSSYPGSQPNAPPN